MKAIGIIPARYASTRFPGKPLAIINKKSMIERVYMQASKAKSLQKIVVATDNTKIYEHVKNFGGEVIMTSEDVNNGTERCLAALNILEKHDKNAYFNIVINIQGDEPFINPEEINTLVNCFNDKTVEIATLIKDITNSDDIFNPTIMKVVTDINNYALYFSRSPIPYIRNAKNEEWLSKHTFYKHIGIYAFRNEILKTVTKLPASTLETAESLEQLRWLQNGYKIKTDFAKHDSYSIDTPEDLKKVEFFFKYNE